MFFVPKKWKTYGIPNILDFTQGLWRGGEGRKGIKEVQADSELTYVKSFVIEANIMTCHNVIYIET